MATVSLLPGRAYPLGATWDGNGVNFALFSAHATAVDLLLFESMHHQAPQAEIRLRERDAFVWHGYVPGLAPSQLYAFRVHCPCDPAAGHRFNPHKAL